MNVASTEAKCSALHVVAPLTESGPRSAAGTAPAARGQVSVRWHAGGRERCVRTPLELLARGIRAAVHSSLEEESAARELRRGCAFGDRRDGSEPLLSASEQAAMAKNEPLLTATEQAEAACSSCKAGNCPRKTDGCGDFLRRSHPDYAGQRSPLEYCVSEFR